MKYETFKKRTFKSKIPFDVSFEFSKELFPGAAAAGDDDDLSSIRGLFDEISPSEIFIPNEVSLLPISSRWSSAMVGFGLNIARITKENYILLDGHIEFELIMYVAIHT